MKARAVLAALSFASLLACSPSSPGNFSLHGSITAPPRFQKLAERPNAVMLIIATNGKGVPVAVRRIINPEFPVRYELGPDDLILPGPVWTGPLDVNCFVNSHGRIGVLKRGDLRGAHPGPVRAGERNVNIVIDEEIQQGAENPSSTQGPPINN